jgi:ubiquinone/menaquinone biosynthesis C-methylase UbiE
VDAADWDARYDETELLWSAQPNRFVVAELAKLTPGRALDIATGEGRNAVWLAEQGWTVTAVDFSATAIDKARRLAEQRGVEVAWAVADALRRPPEAGTFDLVLIAYLHLPAEDLATVITGAARALAPGGTLLLVAHDRRNLTDGVGGPQEPSILTRADEVVELLGDLVIERAGEVERPVETEDGPRVAIDTLVRARRPPFPP